MGLGDGREAGRDSRRDQHEDPEVTGSLSGDSRSLRLHCRPLLKEDPPAALPRDVGIMSTLSEDNLLE